MSMNPSSLGGVASQRGRGAGILLTLVGLLLVVAIGLVGGRSVTAEPKRVVTVSLALGTGDLGDRAFNDSAYTGLQRAQRELGARFRVAPFRGAANQAQNLRQLAQERPDLVIAIGQENAAPLALVICSNSAWLGRQSVPTTRRAV